MNIGFVIRQLLLLHLLSVFSLCLQAERSEVAEAVETGATAHTASELIRPNCVLPALKSFFEQYRK